MPAATDCPTSSELADFAIGRLPRAALERMAAHLDDCPACQQVIPAFDAAADRVLALLRLRRPTEPTDAEVPPPLLTAARAACTRRTDWLAGDRSRLGKFELLEPLGVGSFGTVFKARDTELDRIVAIKILRSGPLSDRQEVDRFLREARSAARLQHPGIVSVHDCGRTDNGTAYLVEEFIEGATLAKCSSATTDFRQAADIVAAVAEALAYAHEHGVIHRDITPANIMLDSQGVPHLMDFGLAKREADEAPVTLDGQILGTPAYMPPEQARGESHEVDARSDIYSLGVILYELLTGERPFRGNRRMLLLQVLQDEPRPPRQLNDKVPRDLETICLTAMAKAPARRYPSARALSDDLRRWAAGEPIKARPIGRLERLGRWCRRNPLAAGLLVAISLGSGLGFVYLSWLSDRLMRSSAVESASQQAEMLEQVNNHYSAVLDSVKRQGFQVTHDPTIQSGAVEMEVPARFTINLGRLLSEQGASGMQVRLYSDHPFKTRKDGGPHDEFERQALRQLRANPDEPFYRFEAMDGKLCLRYAVARRMQESCIRCHNGHPQSTKTDWRVGDVRGVVEIIRPLDRDVDRTRHGLRGTFVLVAATSAALLVLSVAVLVVNRRRGLRPTAKAPMV